MKRIDGTRLGAILVFLFGMHSCIHVVCVHAKKVVKSGNFPVDVTYHPSSEPTIHPSIVVITIISIITIPTLIIKKECILLFDAINDQSHRPASQPASLEQNACLHSALRYTVYALIQIYKQKIIRLYKYATQSPSIHEQRVIGNRLQQVAGCRPRVVLLRYSTIFHCIVLYCIAYSNSYCVL